MESRNGMTDTVLRVDAVRLRRGTRTILDGISFGARRGSVVALMGQSGSGKTTMLRAIAGLERFESGTIAVDGAVVGGERSVESIRALRRKVGMVFQFHYLFDHLTALHNVWLAPVHAHKRPRAAAEARARELLRALGVEHRASALPRELSGGEAQRVAIARALAVDPPVLLMDEPTASLDPARRAELAAIVKSLVGQDRTIVVATHDHDFVELTATCVLRLTDGRVTGESSFPGSR
jgi:ABC-type polar amino acid transport system ATPase subunit